MNIRSNIQVERDSKIVNLEQSLFGKLSNIISGYEPKAEKQVNGTVREVTVEDAIKELLQLSKL